MIDLQGFANATVEFIRQNQAWGPPIAGALAFGESVVVLSFFVPAVGILFAIAALAGASGGVTIWPIFIGVVVGASLGNMVSFWVGTHYGEAFKNWRPIRERPKILAATEAAFQRWGFLAIFAGRFFGPLHGTVATIAAIGRMNPVVFHVTNWLSAAVWAAVVLYGGSIGGDAVRRLLGG